MYQNLEVNNSLIKFYLEFYILSMYDNIKLKMITFVLQQQCTIILQSTQVCMDLDFNKSMPTAYVYFISLSSFYFEHNSTQY